MTEEACLRKGGFPIQKILFILCAPKIKNGSFNARHQGALFLPSCFPRSCFAAAPSLRHCIIYI